MKKIFAAVFAVLEGGLLLLVLCTFAVRHMETGSVYSYGVYFGEDYPLKETYEQYRASVQKRLADPDAEDASSQKSALTDETDSGFGSEPVESKVYQSIMGKADPGMSAVQRLSALFTSIETKIENYTNSQKILGKNSFVELKKSLDRATGLDMTASLTKGQNSETDVRDVVAETEEKQLGWVQDSYDITEELENLVDFGKEMEKEGRNFVLVQNPNKYAVTEGFRDYSEEKYRQIAAAFSDADLALLDLGSEFRDRGYSQKDIFFDTDFHWKPQSGILADQITAEYLNSYCGYSIRTELYEPDMYETELQKEGFLGHLGKKVTLTYTEPEDFPILHPLYPTDYTVYNSYDGSEKTGTLEETLYWQEHLNEKSLYDGNKYEFYGYSDQSLITIRNNKKQNGKRLLVLKESFANCMTPYLAADIERVDVVDLRLFCGSIREYIRSVNPDTVLMVYGLSSYEDDRVEEGLFDFR